ncbi:MAG TPA: N-acetyltransferase [Planctomycetes bacterium]|nr:N-acetyltransferase [Planctomycetota bacterium]
MSSESHAQYETTDPVTGCRFFLYPNVKLGKNVRIYQNCMIGFPPRGKEIGELELVIGDNAVIRPNTSIYAGNRIGDNFETGHNVMMREGNVLGNNCILGTQVVLECNNRFGENIIFHTLSCAGNATLKDNVFVGPHVIMLDDPHPKCPKYIECKGGAVVDEWSRIGGNVTLLPGVKIGRNCLIGGGSSVVRDIPDHSVAVGNPAKVLGDVREQECYPGFYEKPYVWLDGANL